jgi:hypothetical protein
VTLPVDHRRPAAKEKTGNREDPRFVRFQAESPGESFVIHCQVITSQVMAYQPDRDCPVIGRAAPREAATGRRRRQRVILTTLSVGGRCFGRVTVTAGLNLPGQVTSLLDGGARPGAGHAGTRAAAGRSSRAGRENLVAAVPPVVIVTIRYLRHMGCSRGA